MNSQIYEPAIGLEIHAQLLTKNKTFLLHSIPKSASLCKKVIKRTAHAHSNNEDNSPSKLFSHSLGRLDKVGKIFHALKKLSESSHLQQIQTA